MKMKRDFAHRRNAEGAEDEDHWMGEWDALQGAEGKA